MGTRHLICVASGGEYRIAQYGQWDGYPKGQGISILEFLKSSALQDLKNNLKNCTWLTNDEYNELWKEFGVNSEQDSVDYNIYKKFCDRYPELSRDTGAKILDIVSGSSETIKLQNSWNFSQNSLFCEWAYVIDFDKNTFEVYRGLNDRPLNESDRFYTAEQTENKNGMYPIRLLKSFDLSILPSENEFLEICEQLETELAEEPTMEM